MYLRASSAVARLSSWLSRGDRPRKPAWRRWIPAVAAVTAATVFFWIYAVPQLLRFRFRTGMSWYDMGWYGFGPSRTYVSFHEQSPVIEISPAGAQCDQRYTFLAPRGDSVVHPGPMILDAQGELVWMKDNWGTTQDFHVQRYKGQDYVTYWQGDEEDGYGHGSWYMLDSTYTVQYVVSPAGDLDGDLHEFHITPNDTALITIYDPIPYDLTSVGGPELGWLYDGVFQEIDLATGELLFEWRSSSFYTPESSYEPLRDRGHERTFGYDYFHINSVDKNDQGHYLISARHTHTITCIDGATGEVLWSLGGKDNEFTDESNGVATQFAWQHDARWQSPNTLTLFNNAANGGHDLSAVSQGLLLELDIPARKAKVLTSYDHPQDLMVVSQGNLQVLENGNVLVGWGHSAAFTEFSPDGELLCNVHFGASAYFTFGRIVSYRVFKGDWVGRPDTLPDAAIAEDSVFVSWNGATEVAAWRLEAWDGIDIDNMSFVMIKDVDRTGFETEVSFTANVTSFFQVAALDDDGEVLGKTAILQRGSESPARSSILGHSWGVTIIMLFAIGCLFLGLYYAISRVLRRQRSRGDPSYRLVAHKEEDDGHGPENDHLPI
ncbi:hypothetical protein N7532_009656 [Penicillium argentinense]|uniref:Arylsulfotransferase n=1 Tax=Penicillium argentinense TaxID=1131581 RepID=A0A9W9EZV2_9EURO|nr:uncharacterized protein N7532_009656 [Penicillium argentinense]KAJ5090972.1 hypothetical protein N7532_009656 [Penicillium argentinense]